MKRVWLKSEAICSTLPKRIETTRNTEGLIPSDLHIIINHYLFIPQYKHILLIFYRLDEVQSRDNFFAGVNFDLLQIPNLLSILLNSPITAELPSPQRVHNRHLGPLGLIFVRLVHHFLSSNVGLEISTHQICIIVVGDCAD